MSRDPLEELFGPLDSDDVETGAIETDNAAGANDPSSGAPTRAFDSAPTQPAPEVPVAGESPSARPSPTTPPPPRPAAANPAPVAPPRRATQQPASGARPERGTLAEPARAGGAPSRTASHAALPWIVVAVVAVLALVVALVVVNSAKGEEPKPEATTQAPTPTPSSPDQTDAPEPKPEEPVEPKVPKVEVGPNPISMDISFAGISVESSQKLTNPQWFYHAGPPERVMFESGLMNSFPDSCAAMRSPVGKSPWGIEKGEGDAWNVVRPEGTCEADPELYDEVWGLMQAVADSAKPLG